MKCSEETKRKISLAQKGKPRPYLIGRKITWADKIVATRRKNNSYVVSEETRAKMSISGKGRKMPKMTDEHKQKLSESNKKTWSNLELLKKHSEHMKENYMNMPIAVKKRRLDKIIEMVRTPEARERSRKILLEWKKKNPDWAQKNGLARRGRVGTFKGKKHKEISKEKNRNSHLGKKVWNDGLKGVQIAWNKGKKFPQISGEKSIHWKGGITPLTEKIRASLENKLWRESVFIRDNWTCQKTKERGGKLVVHHIQNFSQFPELRFAIDNGITLSDKSHKEFHKKYGIKNNNKKQLEEFLDRKI